MEIQSDSGQEIEAVCIFPYRNFTIHASTWEKEAKGRAEVQVLFNNGDRDILYFEGETIEEAINWILEQ